MTLSKITKSEIEKSVEYMVLAKRYKELNNEIEKVIGDVDSFSTEDFKFLIHKYTQEMLEVGLSLGEFIWYQKLLLRVTHYFSYVD